MLAGQRQMLIVEEVRRRGAVRVSELTELLDVSEMTVRRDLDSLAASGLVEKVHGGATVPVRQSADEPGFEAKSHRQLREKEAIARVLVDEGYLGGSSVVEGSPRNILRIELRYDGDRRPVITGLRRISRPSLRVYVGAKDIPDVRKGLGVNVLSTPRGIMVDRVARRENVGGEVICTVW